MSPEEPGEHPLVARPPPAEAAVWRPVAAVSREGRAREVVRAAVAPRERPRGAVRALEVADFRQGLVDRTSAVRRAPEWARAVRAVRGWVAAAQWPERPALVHLEAVVQPQAVVEVAA